MNLIIIFKTWIFYNLVSFLKLNIYFVGQTGCLCTTWYSINLYKPQFEITFECACRQVCLKSHDKQKILMINKYL